MGMGGGDAGMAGSEAVGMGMDMGAPMGGPGGGMGGGPGGGGGGGGETEALPDGILPDDTEVEPAETQYGVTGTRSDL